MKKQELGDILSLFGVSKGKRSGKLTSKTALTLTGKDLQKLSRRDLAKVVSTVASAANKRIKRASKAGQPIEDTIDKFSVAGKNKHELMKEFTRARNFMGKPELSLEGQKKLARDTAKGLAEKITGKSRKELTGQERKDYDKLRKDIGKALNTSMGSGSEQYDTFWRAYGKLTEKNAMIKENKGLKYRVLRKQISIMSKNPQQSIDELHERMEKEFTSLYQAEQEEKERDTPSDSFTIRE